MIETKHSEIQNQLAEAYSTVFDAELFSDILAEAQALNSNVKFPDDEIVINIDGQIDLTISKIPMSQTTSNQGTAQHIIGRSIDLAFRLLLLQHQRYHVWKTKARLLSHSHKIKQLVSQQDQPQPTLPVTTASPISNPPSTPTNTTPNPVATPTLPVLPTLPKHIPVLLPILALTRFWVQFDRVRHAVHKLTRPFRYAGFSIKTHFKFLNQQPKVGQDVYPGYGELALSLGISLFKGPSLHFGLSQSGSITVCLSQTTVVLQNVSEFETFLSREIKVMCLLTVCSVANPWIRQTKEFIKASSTDQQSFLWQLDQVDEAIHGSVFCHDQWRTITTRLTLREPSYYLEFNLNPTSDLKQKTYQIEIGEANKEVSALNFKERIAVMIKNIMKDASH